MKIIARVISVAVFLCLVSGCGRQREYSDISSGLEEEDIMGAEDDTDVDIENDIDLPGYAYISQSKMEGNVIIKPTCMLLLKDDGTVVGKGESNFGELGNGKRTDCDEWTPVSDLVGVKKIYANYYMGLDKDLSDPEFGACYALTEKGDLYRWGGNILKPECFLRGLKDFSQIGNEKSTFMAEYDNGRKEIITPGGNFTTDIINVTKIVGKNEVLSASAWHIIMKDADNSMSYYIEIDGEEEKEIDEIHRLYQCKCKEVARCKISKDIESVACQDGNSVSVLSKEGAVRHFVYDWEKHSISFEGDWSGKGYKNYFKISGGEGGNKFGLLGDEVHTIGENEFGQLGDGTDLDYWDDWITVDEFQCTELYVDNMDPYCVALDGDGNIWCWGKGFGSTPKIRVGQEDSGDEDIEDY